jgi:hypothetical protein
MVSYFYRKNLLPKRTKLEKSIMEKNLKKQKNKAKAIKQPSKPKTAKKTVKASTLVEKVEKVEKVHQTMIDQILHDKQEPSDLVPVVRAKYARAPKEKPVRKAIGEPYAILVGRKINIAAKDSEGDPIYKVYVSASRCNVNSGDKFDAAAGRIIAEAKIQLMAEYDAAGVSTASGSTRIAESLVPYLPAFKARCERYFTGKWARKPIEVVLPEGNGYGERIPFEVKRALKERSDYERAWKQAEKAGVSEEVFNAGWLARKKSIPLGVQSFPA